MAFRAKGDERTPAVDTMTPRTLAESLAKAVVVGTVSWPEATDRLRAEYERKGETEQAERVALIMAQAYRYTAQPLMDAARIAVKQRRYDDDVRYVRAATNRQETPSSMQLAALLLLRQGDYPAAMRYLQRSVQLAPGEQRMLVPFESAAMLPDLERRRSTAPRDSSVLYQLALDYALTQQYEKSRAILMELLRVAPGHDEGRRLLGRLP